MTRYLLPAMTAILAASTPWGPAVADGAPTPTSGKPALVLEARPHKSLLVVGEPLVLEVALINRGEQPVYTPYARSDTFREVAAVRIEVRRGGETVLSRSLPHNLPKVISPRMPLDTSFPPSPEFLLMPGKAVRAEHTFALVTDGVSAWLGQGTYVLNVSVQLQGFPHPITAEPLTLTVTPATGATQQAFAKVWRPDLSTLIEGEWGKPTEAMAKTAAALKEQFPSVPYRMYIDYRMLWGMEDFSAAREASEAYLQAYPDSPYGDDVLWQLAHLAKHARRKDAARTYFKQLTEQHPDSPFAAEAKTLLVPREAPDPPHK